MGVAPGSQSEAGKCVTVEEMNETPSQPIGGGGISRKGVFGKGLGPDSAVSQVVDDCLKLILEVVGQ